MNKHVVKAGITGLAQINGMKGNTSLEKRIEFDLQYIKNWTLWLDIKIIFITILIFFGIKKSIKFNA
jgi:putative colanic acid biosynthesis UDP-glucose lipid carrier transferase